MANKKRQQTIAKRNRERAVEEKRTLKRLAKQEKREALRNGELPEHDSLHEHDSLPERDSLPEHDSPTPTPVDGE
jgi:hypothetical protein